MWKKSYFTTSKLLKRKCMEKIVSHELQLYVHTYSRKLHTESTLCLVSKVGQKLPEKPDIITGVKPELEKSRARSERRGLPQVPIKMSPVCSHSTLNHTSRCLHGVIGGTPCMSTATVSCESHFVRFLKECATEATENM